MRNYILNINGYYDEQHRDNNQYTFKTKEIREFTVDLFENDLLKLINKPSSNGNTAFNIF